MHVHWADVSIIIVDSKKVSSLIPTLFDGKGENGLGTRLFTYFISTSFFSWLITPAFGWIL